MSEKHNEMLEINRKLRLLGQGSFSQETMELAHSKISIFCNGYLGYI